MHFISISKYYSFIVKYGKLRSRADWERIGIADWDKYVGNLLVMQLVEKHLISRHHWLYQQLDNLCFISKNLFNYANYLIRQKFIATGEYLDYYRVEKLCLGTADYTAITNIG